MLSPVRDASAADSLRPLATRRLPGSVRADLRGLRDQLAPGVADATIARAVMA
ncbi:MAG: hypothetical protein JO147_12915 [Actinobacteria bacterium]|nr:hypothetical protein [Actinomycetota bacterium]